MKIFCLVAQLAGLNPEEAKKEWESKYYKICYTCNACRRRYCLFEKCPDKKVYGWRKRGKVYD